MPYFQANKKHYQDVELMTGAVIKEFSHYGEVDPNAEVIEVPEITAEQTLRKQKAYTEVFPEKEAPEPTPASLRAEPTAALPRAATKKKTKKKAKKNKAA